MEPIYVPPRRDSSSNTHNDISEAQSRPKRKRYPRDPLTTVPDATTNIAHPLYSRKRQQRVKASDDTSSFPVRRGLKALRRALQCETLSDIHPGSYVCDNRLIIPSVSSIIYEHAKIVIPAATGSKRIRFEYSTTSSSKSEAKGNLIATMPTRIHELMKGFASEIRAQMLAVDSSGQAFIPPSWQRSRVLETGSTTLTLERDNKRLKYEPDASLALDTNYPFLVLEVAVAQDARSVKKKAQDYILGSNGRIPFVIAIVVTRRNKQRYIHRDSQDQSSAEQSFKDDDELQISASEEAVGAQSLPSVQTEDFAQPRDHAQEFNSDLQGTYSPSLISTLTDPPSDLSQWSVFPKDTSNSDRSRANPSSTSHHSIRSIRSIRSTHSTQSANSLSSGSSVRLPPLLSTVLDTSDNLLPGDTVHLSVFKSVRKTSEQSRQILTLRALIEDIEIYPRATTASFTMSWMDIAHMAPIGAGPPLFVDMRPLSALARRLAHPADGAGQHEDNGDDGFRPLGGVASRVEKETILTSSSLEVDDVGSGGTVPSSEESRLDPEYWVADE